MVDHLAYVAKSEGITAEPAALGVIARHADGAMRDALSIFDQVAASSRGNITYASAIANLNVLDNSYFERLTDCFANQDVPGALAIYNDIRNHGFDSLFFINGLAQFIRDMMVARDPRTVDMLETTADERRTMSVRAQAFQPDFYYQAMAILNNADLNYRTASNKRFLTELTIIQLCQLLSPAAPAMAPGGN